MYRECPICGNIQGGIEKCQCVFAEGTSLRQGESEVFAFYDDNGEEMIVALKGKIEIILLNMIIYLRNL